MKSLLIIVSLLALVPGAFAQEDVADVSSERIQLGEKQVYFLIGANAERKETGARPLLLILPGGSGGEDFNPFVRRIWKNALPKEFVVAQLVAVPSDDAKQIVWPTAKLGHKKQNFTTESFMADVVADVSKRMKIDAKRVYALGWSSSGPALYASSATEGSPVSGYFVAMSVFKADQLPKPAAMKTKRFYIFHSPDDRVCPIAMAKLAETQLKKLGAKVTLVEYQGGHGWRGDVFGNIRAGMQWLGKDGG
jgi:predicted esterase